MFFLFIEHFQLNEFTKVVCLKYKAIIIDYE